MRGSGPDLAPVDLFPESAGRPEQSLVVHALLGLGQEPADDDVLGPRHRHGHGIDIDIVATSEEVVVDGDAGRVEDEVDDHIAVDRLHQPALGRATGLEPDVTESSQGPVDVIRLHQQVDVVVRDGRAARPEAQAACQRVGNVPVAEGGGRTLQDREHGLDPFVRLRGRHGSLGTRHGRGQSNPRNLPAPCSPASSPCAGVARSSSSWR